MKDTRIKRIIMSVLLSLAMVSVMALTACTPKTPAPAPEPPGSEEPQGITPTIGSVFINVDITAAVELNDPTALALIEEKGGVNADGKAIYSLVVNIVDGSTVLETAQASDLVIATGSSSFGDYITSIDGLADKLVTPESGWTYTINGEMGMGGAGVDTVKNGDVLDFIYVTSWE